MFSLSIIKVICYFGLALAHGLPPRLPEHQHRILIALLYLGVAIGLLGGALLAPW